MARREIIAYGTLVLISANGEAVRATIATASGDETTPREQFVKLQLSRLRPPSSKRARLFMSRFLDRSLDLSTSSRISRAECG